MKKILLTIAVLILLGHSVFADVKDSTSQNGKIVTEYIGIFNDGKVDNFHKCLDMNPPYNSWDITYIAFLHTYYENGYWVANYENARGGKSPVTGDFDKDRIAQLKEAALKVNPDMKFIISLGWGNSDYSNGAQNPVQFAQSVCNIVQENNLDGVDVDYEADGFMTVDAFKSVSQELRKQLDALGIQMGKKMYFTITPATKKGLDFDTINNLYDYVQMQSYDADNDADCPPSTFIPGITSSKLLFGRDIENGDGNYPGILMPNGKTKYNQSKYDINDVPGYVITNNMAGIMGWRVNAGSQMDTKNNLYSGKFSGVIMLGNSFNK